MAITNLGQDGYFRIQKETAYNTQTITSLTFLPIQEGTLGYEVSRIEKANIINNRLRQKEQAGRRMVSGEMTIPVIPDLIGLFFNHLLGAETAVTGDGTTAPYTHAFLIPITGINAGVSWTVEQAIGSDLADRYTGVKATNLQLTSDNEGYITSVLTLVGVDRVANDVERPSVITISTKKQMTFADALIEITPTDVAKFTQAVNSFELNITLGYDEDGMRFKVGSATAAAPIFGTIPSITLTMEIDAERRYEDWANDADGAIKDFAIDLTMTSTEIAVNSLPYKLEVELPKMDLVSATRREAGQDNLAMSLEFRSLGGATTNSDSVEVPGEIRVVDMTTTYTGY